MVGSHGTLHTIQGTIKKCVSFHPCHILWTIIGVLYGLVKNNSPQMCCYTFHISYGCMVEVWQAWNTINTLGSHSSKPQSTQAVGPDFLGENRKTRIPSPGWCMLYHEERQTMNNMLPSIPYVLLVYIQGLMSLGFNQCTMILLIQASKSPNCGTRIGENSRFTPSHP